MYLLFCKKDVIKVRIFLAKNQDRYLAEKGVGYPSEDVTLSRKKKMPHICLRDRP